MNLRPETVEGLRLIEGGAPHSDVGNAERFVDEHGDAFRFAHDRGKWFQWNGVIWRQDADGAVSRAAKATVREMLREAADLPMDQAKAAAAWALKSQSDNRISAMLHLAASERPVAVTTSDFDTDRMILACPSGVIDLETGNLRDAEPDDMCSLATEVPFDAGAECPRWNEFLREIFADDEDLVEYVQCFVGYCLTGDTREQIAAVGHGAGGNGKTVFTEVLKRLLDDFAQTANADAFMRKRDHGIRNDLARLHRARLVLVSESVEDRKLDEATVKSLTGGDTVVARHLYSEYFEFVPQFTLFFVTNHLPRVDGDDDAIWRRLRLIPFAVNFEGREDRDLPAKLSAELPGILQWALKGCLKWQREGLPEAPAVMNATRTYRVAEDVLGQFIEERCTLSGRVATADFYSAYETYCNEFGEQPVTKARVSRRLGKRGIKSAPINGMRTYIGVSLS